MRMVLNLPQPVATDKVLHYPVRVDALYANVVANFNIVAVRWLLFLADESLAGCCCCWKNISQLQKSRPT